MLSPQDFRNVEAYKMYSDERDSLLNRIDKLQVDGRAEEQRKPLTLKTTVVDDAEKRRREHLANQKRINRKSLELDNAALDLKRSRGSVKSAFWMVIFSIMMLGSGMWELAADALPTAVPVVTLILGLGALAGGSTAFVNSREKTVKFDKAHRLALLEYNDALMYNLD